jgi:prolipoprotein diacylglyceryl transferase
MSVPSLVGSAQGLLASFPSPPTDRLELGPLTFRFYGLMIALGVLAAVEMGRRRWEERGGAADDMVELAKWVVPAGLVGTRIYHVITDWKSYQGRWLDAFKIWEGGLGIPGGLLLGTIVGVWYARRRDWDIDTLATAVIPGIPVAQAIGRLGNWFNQEIFGPPTNLFWGVRIDEQFRPAEHISEPAFHPTFLYEALWNLGLAWALIWADGRKLLKPGQMIPLWIFGYGVGRFVVEAVRRDDASLILGIRVNHWVSGVAVVGGLIWLWLAGKRATPAPAAVSTGDPDEEAH